MTKGGNVREEHLLWTLGFVMSGLYFSHATDSKPGAIIYMDVFQSQLSLYFLSTQLAMNSGVSAPPRFEPQVYYAGVT